ncbi:S-layer homology domain-containing protein [Arthrobacter sp. HLT1-21]
MTRVELPRPDNQPQTRWSVGRRATAAASGLLISTLLMGAGIPSEPPVQELGQITGTVDADQQVCVSAFPITGSTLLPGVPSEPVADLASETMAPERPCKAIPGAVQTQPVVDGSYLLDGLEPGSYRLYLDESRPDQAELAGASQWIAAKVLKTAAETVIVEAGVTVVATTAKAFPVRSFADVPRKVQFFKEISWLGSTGITTGWNEGNGRTTFRPVTPIARDAMAAFIYRLAGSPDYTPPAVSPFTDVAKSNVYYKEISWLAGERISTGWAQDDGTRIFMPLSPVARDAMAVFLYRFADRSDLEKPPASPFADVATDNVYFKEISWLASTGISGGWNEGNGSKTFRPFTAVNRDAMAAFMNRYAVMINTQP